MAAANEKSTLEILLEQLHFLEGGGYGPRKDGCTPRLLQDSPSCPNHQRASAEAIACEDCDLMRFVPAADRDEARPCQHIRLNDRKETPESLFYWTNPAEQRRKLRAWLLQEIFVRTRAQEHATAQQLDDAT
jgi:hypothetical protein